MAYGAGVGASLGIVTETTFNTYAAVSRFYEFNSEDIKYNKNVQVGMGLRAGGVLPRSQRRVVTTSDASGSIKMDLATRGLGLILAHSTGTFASPTTVTTGVYSYVFTLGDTSTTSMSVQVGVPQLGGTVTPKTVTGAKVNSFELGVSNGGIATGTFNLDAAGFTTAQSLATPSYSSAYNVFNFAQGAITVDGSPVANIKDFTLSVENSLKTDRYNLGSSGLKSQQIISGFRKISGTLTAEFTDTTLLTKFLNDTTTALSLSFTGATIASTYKESLTITVSAVKFDGDVPAVAGPEAVEVSMSFQGYDNGTDAPLTITYQTADSAL